jgi:hypothetical protein
MGEEAQIDSGPEMEREERRAAVAMAYQDTCCSPFAVSLTKVFVFLCSPDLSPASHSGVTLLQESSLKPRHLPLSTSREVASIRLWGW